MLTALFVSFGTLAVTAFFITRRPHVVVAGRLSTQNILGNSISFFGGNHDVFRAYYRPPTKFQEENVFSRVCRSICSGEVPVYGPAPPSKTFKHVHYVAHTVGKRAVGIRHEMYSYSYRMSAIAKMCSIEHTCKLNTDVQAEKILQ